MSGGAAAAVLAPLSWQRAVTTWVWHPVPVALIILLGGWYIRRVHRLRCAGGTWPTTRGVWFALGLASYGLVTSSVIGAYHPALFSVRAVQVVTLLMITPQLWAHGLPGTLARDTATSTGRRIASRLLHARTTQLLTHPLVGVVLMLGLPIGLYGTGWYTASLTSHTVDELTQLILLAGGFHYFWTRLQRDPVPRLFPQYLTAALTFAEISLDVIVPLALFIAPGLIAADYYAAPGRDWGVDLRADQNVGAGVLWLLGDLALLPFLLLSVKQLSRRDQADAVAIDTELDRIQAADQPPAGDGAAAMRQPATMRPWWENDAYLAEHFRWARPTTPTRPAHPGKEDRDV